jgi:hypothetical protein
MRIVAGDDLNDYELADFPGLLAASQFARMLRSVLWFTALGEPPDERELLLAGDYLTELGFPDAEIVMLGDWEEAADAALNTDWNTEAWEAEEQLRMALIAEACERADEEMVMVALANVSAVASESAQAAAEGMLEQNPNLDEELLRAAIGAVAQASYHSALVLAAEAEDPERHPFSLKFRLFEAGRWPLGVVGRSFHLF